MEASPPSSLVLGIRPGGRDPASQWERERSERRMPPVTWEAAAGERGAHLLVTGGPGSGFGSFCNGLVAQAIEQGHGVVLFEICDRLERGAKAFRSASENGREAEVEIFDWSGLKKAHESFRPRLLQVIKSRQVALISLPDSDEALSMIWAAVSWMQAGGLADWEPGKTLLFWPEVHGTFDGLRHRLACSQLADRQVSVLFHSSGLERLRNHGGDGWWHNLLEPLSGLVLFRTNLVPPLLEEWNRLKGPRKGPQAYPDTLDLRDLNDKQAWLDVGSGWEQVRAFQPTQKPNGDLSRSQRFITLALKASEEAERAPYLEHAQQLASTLPICEQDALRPRL